ncbi:hypothetical protein TNCV_2757601 [Trichonephila clavipes]|nr:hypothetical protein TNCV_2757601 [Trichonephila clavipes]
MPVCEASMANAKTSQFEDRDWSGKRGETLNADGVGGLGSMRYRPPPRSERYGSCSVLATVDREGRVYRRGGHPVPSRETIRRRLTEVGLRSRRPLSGLPLTPHHRQCRLDFADLGQLGV